MPKKEKDQIIEKNQKQEERVEKLETKYEPSKLQKLPVTYQEIIDFFAKLGNTSLFPLRKETIKRIERITKRPLICYVTKTINLAQGIPAYIDDGDVIGFGDLIKPIEGKKIDIFLVSNGSSPTSTERIVKLLRTRFQ